MWRPEGFNNPYKGSLKESTFELGADAMLEALKERGFYMDNSDNSQDHTYLLEVELGAKGTWCFIPDECNSNEVKE